MKLPFAFALAVVAAPVLAQSTPAPAPAATPAAATKFNLDTPIETLQADPAAKAVVTANLPDLAAHPMYDSFKGMSLNQLAPMSAGKITDELLKKVGKELSVLK